MRGARLSVFLLCAMCVALTACKPPWQRAYDKCRARMQQEVDRIKKSKDKANVLEGPMKELAAGVAGGIGGAMCESIKSICEPNPEGRACYEISRAFNEPEAH